MSRNKMRKPPGKGSQRHAKLGKRPEVDSGGSKQAEEAFDKTKEVIKPPAMPKPQKAKPNKSGNPENVDTI